MKNTKIFIPSILLSLTLCSCGTHAHNIDEYILNMNWREGFKILQLSDIHLANKDDQKLHLDFLESVINDAKGTSDKSSKGNLDLIICTGDLFTFADKDTAKTLFSFLDSYSVPWTVTFGNHDEQCYFSIDWMTGYLNKLTNNDSSFCVFKDIQDDNVFGNCNFAIDLKDGSKTKYQIILMDSNRYNYGGKGYIGYDYIKENQIEWYKDLTDYEKANNDDEFVDSLLFFHIPLPEFETAWNLYQEGSSEVRYIHGEAGEGISCPDYNSGFFDVLKNRGSKGIFCSHDHISDWAIEYQGVTLSYGVTSTDRIYANPEMMGGTTITLNADNSFTITHLFHTYGEAK